MTSLQQQLRSIAVAAGLQGDASDLSKSQHVAFPSVLYEPAVASDIHVDQLYAEAISAFNHLTRLDPRFASTKKVLFVPPSSAVRPNAADATQMAVLRDAVDVFCRLLQPHFLSAYAQHALEYLIRVFHVHENCVESLMKCGLAYHDCVEFSRLVRVARVEGTVFGFLRGNSKASKGRKDAGPPEVPKISRNVVVARMVRDRALLRFVCEMAKEFGSAGEWKVVEGSDRGGSSRSVMGWYGAVMCEMVERMVKEEGVGEEMVGFLLPYVVRGLGRGVVAGYRDATCMVVGGLSGKVVMRRELVDALARDIASSATPATLPQTLLILSYLAVSQSDNFELLPPQAFDNLSRLPNLATEVSKLTSQKKKAARFGYLLMCAAVDQTLEADDGKSFDVLIKSTSLGDYSSALASVFLEKAKEPLKGAKKARLIEMMRLFDVFHGEVLDRAVNEYLSCGSDGADRSDRSASRKNVLAILESSLEDTVRAPLLDANVTLSAGIDHAQASIRIMALERLNEICSQSDSKLRQEAEVTLKGALSRRLEDDDMGVVLTALNLSTLSDMMPEKALLDVLIHSVERCMGAVYDKGSGKRTRGLGRKAVKAALRLLGGLSTSSKNNGVENANLIVTAALLSVIFAGEGSYTVSVEALEILAGGKGPLAGALKECVKKHSGRITKKAESEAAGGRGKATKETKTPKVAKRAREADANASSGVVHNFDVGAYNRDVIIQLAKAALSDESAYQLLLAVLKMDSPLCSPYAKPAVLCVFEQSVMMSPAEKKASSRRNVIAQDVVQWFYTSRDLPGMEARKSHIGLRTLWDARTKSISDQIMSDLACRMCSAFSIEPEPVFMCLEAVSEHTFALSAKSASRPSPTELYAYLAQLPAEVYSQHLDVLLKKVQNPLDMLFSVWTSVNTASAIDDKETSAAATAAAASLNHWSAYISSTQKLTEAEKIHVVKSTMSLVCAMMHPTRGVRCAAMEASARLFGSINGWWPNKTMGKWTKKDTIGSLFELCAKNGARILGDSDGVEYLLQQVAETTSSGKQRKKGKSPRASDVKINVVFFDADAMCSFLMQELCESSATSLAAVPILVRTLEFSSESGKLCGVASDILDKMFYDIETEAFTPSLDPAEQAAAVELVNVLNDPVLHQSSQKRETVLRASLCAAQWTGHPELREVALKALGHCSRGQTTDQDMQSICRVLMTAASSEPVSACRDAAIETLDKVTIKPTVLIPFLQLAQKIPSSSKRRKGSGPAAPLTSSVLTSGSGSSSASSGVPLCLHTLELMQWKKGIHGMDLFVRPLQDLAQQFLALSLSTAAEGDDEDTTGSGPQGPAVSGYGLQLCLQVLLNISEDSSLEAKTRALFDTKAIVGCASTATDQAARTAALELLRSRIESNPDGAMEHIMTTVRTICVVASNEHDKYSTVLAAKAMSTAAAAWIGRGNSIHDLVSNVVDAINDSSTSRKYAILGAIVDSMPSNAAETMASIAYHLLLSVSSDGARGDSIDKTNGLWQQDAAFSMLSKRKKAVCVSALGGMLQLCITCSKKSKFEILRQANTIARKVLTTHAAALRRLQEQPGEQSGGLFDSYEIIMQSILKGLQIVGKSRAKNSDPLLVELEDGSYAVLDALMDTMNHIQFINSLVRSLSYGEMTDAMRRKSLQLISHVVTTDMALADPRDPAVCQCVLDTVSALVLVVGDAKTQTDICRQMALETLNAFIQRFGAQYSDVFLQAIPPTVDLACEAELPGVRGMALICIASSVNSMKSAVIPVVPRVIKAVVGSMSSMSSMSSSKSAGGADAEASEAEYAAALTALKALSEHLAPFLAPNLPEILGILLDKRFCSSSAADRASGDDDGADGDDHDDGVVGAAVGAGRQGRATSTSLYNVHALADGCRTMIATAVPARLLVGPLSTMLEDIAEEKCESRSALELMNMLAVVISNMDSTAVATYTDALFSMVLKALDTRRLRPAENVQAIESAAVNCMLHLVLKLNETKFKPIFYRLLEWATRPPPGDATSSLDRKISFFNVINTLTENLKSVFTSYYSALVELFLDALLYEAYSDDKDDLVAVNTLKLMAMRSLTRCFMYDTSEFLDETTFNKLLEPIVNLMTTTHKGPPTASSKRSKSSKPPKSTQGSTSFASIPRADALIDNAVSASCPAWMRAELSILSTTIIACLSQMATASGMNDGESRWRPLHHAVLMATRANDPDGRCTALETVMAICHTLQEEYLVLVPEALPFLSELLEDEDPRVEKRAVEALNLLSEKSGEDLQQYLVGAS